MSTFLFLIFNLFKKRNIYLSFLLFLYPLSLLYSKNNLSWSLDQLIYATIGGLLFFLILMTVFKIKNEYPKASELALLGIVIILSALIVPWLSSPMTSPFPQDADTSPNNSFHRYFTVPLAGISLAWGVIATYFWDSLLKTLKLISLKRKPQLKLSVFLKIIPALTIIFLLFYFFIINGVTTRDRLIEASKALDKNRDEQIWKIIKPAFVNISDRKKSVSVYRR